MVSSGDAASNPGPAPANAPLKDLVGGLWNPSQKRRRELWAGATKCIKEDALQEPQLKGLAKLLPSVLPRYVDGASRFDALNMLRIVLKQKPSVATTALTTSMADVFSAWAAMPPSEGNARTALTAFRWTAAIFKETDEAAMKADQGKKLLQLQAVLLNVVVSSGKARLVAAAVRAINNMWRENAAGKKAAVERLSDKTLTGSGIPVLVLAAYYIDLLRADKDKTQAVLSDKLYPVAVEQLVQLVVSSKTKAELYLVRNLSVLCKHVQHEDFKGSILPAMQKAMLRNPEICLDAIGQILASLKIDLSAYVSELQKPFGTNLHAKDDVTREAAVVATVALAGQCSDPAALSALLKTLFGVLGGSEGKLSVNTHKISLLQAIGGASKNAVTGNAGQEACTNTISDFIKVLESEVHEGTLLVALEMCSMWMAKLTSGLPDKFTEWFPKGITAKAATSNTRSACFTCLCTALENSGNLQSAVKLIPTMMRTVENCVKQSSQSAIVAEGAQAARCLVKLASLESEVADQMAEFWKIALDTDKQLFTNERFLLAAPASALKCLVDVTEKVLLEVNVEKVKQSHWLRVLSVALTSSAKDTRLHAQASVKRIIYTLGGDILASELLVQLNNHLLSAQVVHSSQAQELESKEPSNSIVSAKTVVDALFAMVKGAQFGDEEKSVRFACDLLVPAHHPVVKARYPALWTKLVARLELTPAVAIAKSKGLVEKLLESLDSPANLTQASLVVEAVVTANADATVPAIVQKFSSSLKDGSFKIGMEEFETWKTPAGELYDQRVMDAIQNEGDATKNVKRESKAYSYKEQMEEIQLRKELEEKKRREGKLVAPKLTPKQKEMMHKQMEKEANIRADVQAVVTTVEPTLLLLASAVKGNPKAFAGLITQTTAALFRGFTSPITAERCTQVFFDLRRAVFEPEDETLSQVIAGVTLQLKKPFCSLPNSLTGSALDESARKVVTDIGAVTVAHQAKNEEDACPFSAPAFNYAFPLIQHAVGKFQSDDDFLIAGCDIIAEHASLRGLEDEESSLEEADTLHPKYLPRAAMLAFLIDLISSLEGTPQQAAVKTLIEVADAASAKHGCATAEEDEIQMLLGALQNDVEAVRDAGLRGLLSLKMAFRIGQTDAICKRVWVARFDPSEENQALAKKLWKEANFEVYDGLCLQLIDDVVHPVGAVRTSSAEALAEILKSNPEDTQTILTMLLDTYQDRLEMTPAVRDHLNRVVQEPIDHWQPRSGVAIAIGKIAPFFDMEMVSAVASFLVPDALGDRQEAVRTHMLEAALATIEVHGKDAASTLLPVFEDFLEKAPSSGSFDNVRQSVIILMGSLAKHLDSDDPRVRPIMRQLILALNTPSQQVQEEVAKCLPPLVPTIKEEAPDIVSNLIKTLLGSNIGYGERKGAAYGIAGIVKGLGILSLKQLNIMGRLTDAIQDKKNPTNREGALFAFEMLCNMLGRLFEPYIVHILPHLLLCFGDPIEHVRQAADDTARAVMSKLSAHGVKLVLPSLLNALEEDQWRTKAGSVELLGAMAYCAPKQLSSCLPSIVPKLIEVLGDSHHKVQSAGVQALKQIGAVIRNPEIQAIVPILLRALQDPAKRTGPCLQTLLDTKFVHFIDAPSLALIMPVVQRAFADRSTETRKMAAQIIGNMYSLTDQKDLKPYLPGILPGLKNSLLDPVPEVRAVSARALGAMVRGMGEESFEDLLPWLMSTLTSETSSVDRSGAAQGLAEVVGGLGVEKMNALMPDIIKTAERTDIAPHVKDGYIMMFIYMPSVFPEEFTSYIGQIISPVLRALADENEFVRETAYKAGQRLVTAYAETAMTLLLPELEKGLFDDNWRIRHSSVQLLGDLLYKISGVTGKMTTETAGDDDNFGTEASQKIIIQALGLERRNRVLAGLYMGRSDVALMVRQASLHVWKVIVTNTPKTLREVLPTLFNLLLGCLASSSYDKRQVAARTLGDLVKKLGERVLPEIIPILERGLESEKPEERQGVCVGLSEIMTSTSRDMVLSFVDSLVPTVRKALCDKLPEVREAAAKTFDSLHNTVGSRALDDILPPMLEQLDDDELHDSTLDGLRQVMAIKSRAVLPYLVPQLIAKPVNSKALASLAPVAGEALHRHLSRILPALLEALAEAHGTENEQREQEYAQTVVLAIDDEEEDVGVSIIMEELLKACKAKDVAVKRGAVQLLHAFCSQTKVDYSQYVPQLIRALILLFTEEDPIVLMQAWHALGAVTKTLDASEQMDHVGDVRQAVRFALSDMKGKADTLPGFCLPKGIQPILPIFRESILNGPPELKEQASVGLGEVIMVTSPEALKPSVVHITGPLIRILGDRFNSSVKVAVLDTLASLLFKAKDMLKPFFPQLQTTFMKALNDVNRSVRLKAGAALSFLITIHMRPDPLFNELYNGIKNADDAAVRDTYVQAMRGCIEPSGDRMSAPIRKQILQLLSSYVGHGEDSTRTSASGCLGAFCKWLPEEDVAAVMSEHLTQDDTSLDWTVRHGRSTALFVALKDAPERIFTEDTKSKVVPVILAYLSCDRMSVAQNGVRCCGYLFDHCVSAGKPVPTQLIPPFCKTMNHANNDVKQLVPVVSIYIAKRNADDVLPVDLLRPLLPMLVNGTKEKNSYVKSTSEHALVAVLQLRGGGNGDAQKRCLSALDSGAKDALQDVISKVLNKLASQPEGRDEVLDNTVLS